MLQLEAIDAADRRDGTPRPQRLRQVSRETGKVLALLAAAAPPGSVLEVGTSGGYSTLWLALAARARGDIITTFEILPQKAELARQTFELAGIAQSIQVVDGDARTCLDEYPGVAFCFLDAEKDVYMDCYESVVPRLVPGGFIVADNVISHQAELEPFVARASHDGRVDALVLSVGKGLLIARRRSEIPDSVSRGRAQKPAESEVGEE